MNKFEKRMKQELDDYTPDLKQNIKDRANFPVKDKKKNIKWQYIATPIMATMILLVVILTPIFVLNPVDSSTNTTPALNIYTLSMQVIPTTAVSTAGETISNNPSVALTYGDDHRVKNIKPLNEDGIVFVSSSRLNGLEGLNLGKATKRVVGEMKYRGCFENGKLEMIVVDQNGSNNENEFTEIKNVIQKDQILQNIDILAMSEDELDALEDDIEKNEELYYNEFKTDINVYLNKKLPKLENLANSIYEELQSINESLQNIEVLDSVDEVKKLAKESNTLIFNDNIINIINTFIAEYPQYDDIELDVEEGEEIDNKTFFKAYEEIIEEYEEVLDAIEDIKNGNIPEDIDDMLEDIFFNKQL